MVEMRQEQIIDLLKSGEKVLLDFYTSSCSVCKVLAIQLEQAEEFTDVPVIKVNAEEYTDLAERFEIMKVPQLIVVKDDQEVHRHVGFLPKEEIISLLDNE